MSGLLFLLFNVGVVLAAHWCWQNDSPSVDGATKGLFAMAKPPQPPASATASPARARKVMLPELRLPRLTRR